MVLLDRPIVSSFRPTLATALVLTLLAPALVAQGGNPLGAVKAWPSDAQGLAAVSCPRIADPKLPGAVIEIAYRSWVGAGLTVTVDLLQQERLVTVIDSGPATSSPDPIVVAWNGKDQNGAWVDPGEYVVRVRLLGSNVRPIVFPLTIVRLGITAIEATASALQSEWQMVYFRKGGTYAFYATPAIHEYLSTKDNGEISELDLDNGAPRPTVPVHITTDEPVMEGSNYEDDRYNYPLAYLMGTQPVFDLTLGSTGTSASGVAVSANYPVVGYDLRVQGQDSRGAWTTSSTSITPGGTVQLTGPALPAEATRDDLVVTWTWQYRASGTTLWENVPGSFDTTHRIYTQIARPQAAIGAEGIQHRRPWVEVAEYFYTWKESLGVTVVDESTAATALFIGFFGQTERLPTAIEGVLYDCGSNGGDSGATHYYSQGARVMDLSALLNGHAKGRFVNCSDCAGGTSVMISMLGVTNIQLVRLGRMTLQAIWGIGSPGYTLNLWGGSHSFSYHHIVTRFGGDSVCDSCMALDEDNDPTTLPGKPGYNVDRPWSGPNGYDTLSSRNQVSKSLEPLPKIK